MKYWKLALGIILTQWPLPLSIWFGVRETGWRLTLIVSSCALGAVAIIGCGCWLLNSAASLPKKEGE